LTAGLRALDGPPALGTALTGLIVRVAPRIGLIVRIAPRIGRIVRIPGTGLRERGTRENETYGDGRRHRLQLQHLEFPTQSLKIGNLARSPGAPR
jgi:hypothetical protein